MLALVEDLSLEKAQIRLKEKHELELKKSKAELEKRVKERTRELRRAQERLLQSERLKVAGELAGAVAHNFNNVLQVVMGGAQLALENLKAGDISDAKKNMELIIDGSRSAADLVKRLKSFAKQSPPDAPKTPEIFDVSELFPAGGGNDEALVADHPGQQHTDRLIPFGLEAGMPGAGA